MEPPKGWTEEQITALKALNAEGKSLLEMAAALGFTRGQVSGVRFRLKLKSPVHYNKAARRAPVERPEKPTPKVPITYYLINLGLKQCRFVLSPGVLGNAICCGGPTVGDCSWCSDHFGVVYKSGIHAKDNFILKKTQTTKYN